MIASATDVASPPRDNALKNARWGAFLRAAILASAGLATGWLAWQSEQCLVLLLVLPLAAAHARRRWQVFALMAGYFATGSASLPGVTHVFFQNPSPFVAYGAPAALTALLAAPFMLFDPAASRRRRAATYSTALIALTVPPIGMFAWMNPLMLAGTLYPHAGLAGVAGTGLLMAALAALPGRQREAKCRIYAAVAMLMAGSMFMVYRHGYVSERLGASLDYAAVDMQSPPSTTAHGQTMRTEVAVRAMREAIALPWSKIVVLPESAVSPYRPVDEIMLFPPSDEARDKDKAIVFGAVILGPNRTWRDVVMGAGTLANPDGTPRILDEPRLLMPLGNWHLGFPGGATPHPFSTDQGEIDGRPVAWSICFEDTVLWPHRFLLTGSPTAMLSLGNDWALRGTFAEWIQRLSAMQLARMAGVPLIAARNR